MKLNLFYREQDKALGLLHTRNPKFTLKIKDFLGQMGFTRGCKMPQPLFATSGIPTFAFLLLEYGGFNEQ